MTSDRSDAENAAEAERRLAARAALVDTEPFRTRVRASLASLIRAHDRVHAAAAELAAAELALAALEAQAQADEAEFDELLDRHLACGDSIQ